MKGTEAQTGEETTRFLSNKEDSSPSLWMSVLMFWRPGNYKEHQENKKLEALELQATQHIEAKRYPEALQLLLKAQDEHSEILDKTPGREYRICMQIAQCYEHLQHFRYARDFWQKAHDVAVRLHISDRLFALTQKELMERHIEQQLAYKLADIHKKLFCDFKLLFMLFPHRQNGLNELNAYKQRVSLIGKAFRRVQKDVNQLDPYKYDNEKKIYWFFYGFFVLCCQQYLSKEQLEEFASALPGFKDSKYYHSLALLGILTQNCEYTLIKDFWDEQGMNLWFQGEWQDKTKLDDESIGKIWLWLKIIYQQHFNDYLTRSDYSVKLTL